MIIWASVSETHPSVFNYSFHISVYIYVAYIVLLVFDAVIFNATTMGCIMTKIKFNSARCSQPKKLSVSTVSALVKKQLQNIFEKVDEPGRLQGAA